MADNEQLAALKTIWQSIEAADRGVMAYLGAGGQSNLAIEALTHPMKGLQGRVEGLIFDISPDALAQMTEPAPEASDDPIMDAYAAYDSDARVNGPDDFEAFRDAVTSLAAGNREGR